MRSHRILTFLIGLISIMSLFNLRGIHGQEHFVAKTKAIRDYLTLCSNNDVCTLDASVFSFSPCCGLCSCDDACGFDCCPDGGQDYMTVEEIIILKANDLIKCVKPTLRTNDYFSEHWPFYEMIARCPSDFDDEVTKRKCLHSYEHFNLDDRMWNVPVTINNTNMTYKNVFCALCNGAEVQDSVIWELVLSCQFLPFVNRNYLSVLNISSVNDIPQNVSEDYCNVLFQTPKRPGTDIRLQDTKQCPGLIDRCNVTGQWKGEPFPSDYHIESACLSYKSVYKGYRNIHCYLCNGGNFSSIETDCFRTETSSRTREFTLVIRNAIFTNNQTCSSDFIFDASKNTCRRLHCSQGFVFDGIQCVPFLQPHFSGFLYYVYEVILTFEPDTSSLTKKVTKGWIHRLISQITSDVKFKLRRPGQAEYFSTCDSRSFMKYKRNTNDLVDTLKQDVRQILFFDVMYFAVSFRISITNITNMVQKIGELEALFNVTPINVAGNVMMVKSRIIDPVRVDKLTEQDENVRSNRSEPAVSLDSVRSLGLEIYMEDTLLNSVIDDSDGSALSTIPSSYNIANHRGDITGVDTCDSIAVINKDVFCPKVELKSGEFTVDGDTIRILSLNRCISRDVGLFDSGWSKVRICKNIYLDLVRYGPVSGVRAVTVSSFIFTLLVGMHFSDILST